MTNMYSSIEARAKVFKSLPVSDWHQIIAFEKVVRNYIKIKNLLMYYGKTN